MFEELPTAFLGTEVMLLSIPEFSNGVALWNISVADLVLDHDPLNGLGFLLGSASAGEQRINADCEKDDVEKESK